MNSAKLNLFSPISYMHEERLIDLPIWDDQIFSVLSASECLRFIV